ncbi:hypothetical protein [Bradyrhizobium sp. CCGB01]|uniref:hypothetical protein n=1 Tax=Bradyrhizobium sp. CCGB01 TaxID=2949634 RepID=UPI0020B26601|nr:hypothetical protein [Bradyrhizobium sp. CCGB01]MCP3410033.1 hypothetical protein [Bradyrhizobium sp. CCGB01]
MKPAERRGLYCWAVDIGSLHGVIAGTVFQWGAVIGEEKAASKRLSARLSGLQLARSIAFVFLYRRFGMMV